MVVRVHRVAGQIFPALPHRGRPLVQHKAPAGIGRLGDNLPGVVHIAAGGEHIQHIFGAQVAGGQVMALGALAQRLAVPVLTFDREKLRFTDNDAANALLDGPPVRQGWEEFARL